MTLAVLCGQVRSGLSPGARRIRTRGPALRRAALTRRVTRSPSRLAGESSTTRGEPKVRIRFLRRLGNFHLGRTRQITNSWETPRTSTSKSRPCTWRAREMPSQTARHGCPADELVGQERMDIEDGINLGRGHIRPAAAERRDAPLHRPEHEARFLLWQTVRRDTARLPAPARSAERGRFALTSAANVTMPSQDRIRYPQSLPIFFDIPFARALNESPWIAGSVYR